MTEIRNNNKTKTRKRDRDRERQRETDRQRCGLEDKQIKKKLVIMSAK